MRINKKFLIPLSGLIYGQIIYWITLLSSFLVVIGTLVSFLEEKSPVPASYLLRAVIDGKTKNEIWQNSSLNSIPKIPYFLAHINYGESITMIGISLGVSSVIPATFVASYFLWKSRNPAFACIAIIAGCLICFASIS